MSDGRVPGDFEDRLRRALRAEASSVRVDADLADLRRRIEGRRPRPARSRLAATAAVVLVASAVGAATGSLMVPSRTRHALLSGLTGNQGGPLPVGPTASRSGGRLAPFDLNEATAGLRQVLQAPVGLARTGQGGTRLAFGAAALGPVRVSGGRAAGCYGGELVTTTASKGAASGSATGVVGMQPLAATGLEIVDSGFAPSSSRLGLWWATVAVGPRVARVAAEQPGGLTDEAVPTDGLAVLGGVVPAAERGRIFSAVAENASGHPLQSLGFLLGFGPRLQGGAGGVAVTRAAGCGAWSAPGSVRPPASPLLAAASVVAAFHQAFDPPNDALAAAMSAVESTPALGRSAGVGSGTTSDTANGAAGRAAQSRRSVVVADVAFISSRRAEVVYRLAGRSWSTASAVLDAAGAWQVGIDSFCGVTSAGGAAGLRPSPAMARACRTAMKR